MLHRSLTNILHKWGNVVECMHIDIVFCEDFPNPSARSLASLIRESCDHHKMELPEIGIRGLI